MARTCVYVGICIFTCYACFLFPTHESNVTHERKVIVSQDWVYIGKHALFSLGWDFPRTCLAGEKHCFTDGSLCAGEWMRRDTSEQVELVLKRLVNNLRGFGL